MDGKIGLMNVIACQQKSSWQVLQIRRKVLAADALHEMLCIQRN